MRYGGMRFFQYARASLRGGTLVCSLALAAGAATSGCSGDDGGTGAVCPTVNPPTYDTFAASFFSTHCTGCHSSARTGGARGGAPVGRDYDTLEGIRAELDDIDAAAAAGPDAVNQSMPLGTPKPTVEQRTMLGEFLACEKAK
jgi:uncharacterized membrane protein